MISYKFRLYPNKEQTSKLEDTLNNCRFTYNKLLEKLNSQETINRKEIQHHILKLKEQNPFLENTHSKVLQYECYRLFSNIRALSQLKKKNKKIGKLRFKGKDWFKTFQYNQSGYELIIQSKRNNLLKLSKIGLIPIRCHQELNGNIKQITIKKSNNKWCVSLVTDYNKVLQKGNKQIGLDLGIINFVADSDGNKLKSPLHLKQSLDKIKNAHKELSHKVKGSNNRKKAKLRLSILYDKITNQRDDFLHKLSTKYIKDCNLIALEKLNIKKLEQISYNARNITDCSWNKFTTMLKYKAESAGVKLIEVNPMNTSKECNNCRNIQDMPLSHRTYNCDKCGISIDRDINSAINILGKGLAFVENESNSSNSMKQEALTSNSI